jgi:hypothetical protein
MSMNALIWAPTFSNTKFLGQQPNGALSKGAERRMQQCGHNISNKLVDACEFLQRNNQCRVVLRMRDRYSSIIKLDIYTHTHTYTHWPTISQVFKELVLIYNHGSEFKK